MKKNLLQSIENDFTPGSLPDDDPTTPATKPIHNAKQIPITAIIPDPNQPRKTFNQQSIRELAESARARGIIEPLTVRQRKGEEEYLLVTGERRFRAAQQAGLTHLPCIIRNLNDEEAYTLQIIENVQREDLKPVEEAKSYRTLLENKWTQAAIAKLVGKSQPYVAQLLKILSLPESILQEADRTSASKEHLLQLTKSENPQQVWIEITRGKTAREIKKQIQKEMDRKGRPKNYRYTYSPKGKLFKVTVEFRKPHPTNEEIIEALKDTLALITDEPHQSEKGDTQ